MIWYHYWVSEVKRFRGIVRHVVNESPIFKNKSVNYPWTNILHVWIKICRSSSILRIPVIIIKNNRNRNLKYKSLQNSVLILGPGPTFLKKRSPQQYWSEVWMKDGIWKSYTLSSYPLGSLQKCSLRDLRPKKVVYAAVHTWCFTKC